MLKWQHIAAYIRLYFRYKYILDIYTVDPKLSNDNANSPETIANSRFSCWWRKNTFYLYFENSAYLANHCPQQFQDMNGGFFGWFFRFHSNMWPRRPCHLIWKKWTSQVWHRGVGSDGIVFFTLSPSIEAMRLAMKEWKLWQLWSTAEILETRFWWLFYSAIMFSHQRVKGVSNVCSCKCTLRVAKK